MTETRVFSCLLLRVLEPDRFLMLKQLYQWNVRTLSHLNSYLENLLCAVDKEVFLPVLAHVVTRRIKKVFFEKWST